MTTSLRPKGALQTSPAAVRLVRPATLDQDGYMISRFADIEDAAFNALQEAEYAHMRPGRNAKNQLERKTGWGAYLNDSFVWSDREEYSLPAKLNEEEGGTVRFFDPLSRDFLSHPITEDLLRAVFNAWDFEKDSAVQLYQIQLSAIRYEPTFDKPALPSPIEPHQDLVDGAIVLLSKTPNLIGGTSRLYDLDQRPLVELDLDVGDILFVRDADVLHQVTPLQLAPGTRWSLEERAYRDVLLIRFQAVGR